MTRLLVGRLGAALWIGWIHSAGTVRHRTDPFGAVFRTAGARRALHVHGFLEGGGHRFRGTHG